MFKEAKRRVRWLTPEQAETLLSHLPAHQVDIVRFALATGLRQGNVTRLEWSQIDMQRRVAWIHADQAKSRKAIFVPLNEAATAVIRRQIGKHDERVFTYRGNPVGQVNTAAWRRALSKAGIENFRWHDLRHTWASWHVQAGTPVNELQELGGWESVEMVRRYAHLASGNLANAAARIEAIGTKMATATPVLSAVG
jgi:integrase